MTRVGLVGLTLLVAGCSDATGPTEEVVQTTAPAVYMYRDVNGGGGGGGGGNAPLQCSRPNISWQCMVRAGLVSAAAAATAVTCGAAVITKLGPVIVGCGVAAGSLSQTAENYIDTPNCPDAWCQIPSYPTIGADHNRSTNFGEN